MMINLAFVVPNFAADIYGYIQLPLMGVFDLILLGVIGFNFVHSRADDGGRSSIMGHLLQTGVEVVVGFVAIYVLCMVIAPTLLGL